MPREIGLGTIWTTWGLLGIHLGIYLGIHVGIYLGDSLGQIYLGNSILPKEIGFGTSARSWVKQKITCNHSESTGSDLLVSCMVHWFFCHGPKR